MKHTLRKISIFLLVLMLSAFCLISCGEIDTPTDSSSDTETDSETKVVYSLEIRADKTVALRGENVNLSAFFKDGEGEEDITNEVQFSIVEGSEIASLTANMLSVSKNATHGSVIKVKAIDGATSSNELTITVKVPATELEIGPSDVTNILAGQSQILSATIKPTGADSDVVYSIVEGAESADIQGNVLVIKADAKTGSVVKVQATVGEKTSNVLTFTVGIPLEKLEITSDSMNVMPGESAIVKVTKTPDNSTNGAHTLVFAEETTYATISGDVIIVNKSAPTGAEIKVKAIAEGGESNVLTFTVGIPLEKLEIQSAVTNILAGSTAQLFVTKTPANATNGDYTIEIVEGAEHVIKMGDTITVKAGTPTGTKIKVKAVAEGGESETLEFIVGYPLENLVISLVGSSNIEPGKSADIKVTLDPKEATDVEYGFFFTAGEGLATVQGNTITINEGTEVGSTIKLVAKTPDGKTSNEIVISVGVPITNVELSTTAPEVLERGESYEFDVDVDPDDATLSALEWGVTDKDGKKVDFATIKDGVLTISKNAPAGSQIIVYAASGSVKDEMTFTVGVALEKIDISIGGSTENINIDPGATSAITSVLTPSNASDTVINWVITEGNDYATITNGFISINSNAPVGAIVKFHAEIVGLPSNDITVTVGTPITGIEINALKTDIVKGEGVTLSAIFTPSNASASLITWEIIDGNEFAELVGTNLMIKSDATTGETITVKASFGNVSDEIVFTVMPTQAEIDATTYRLSLSTYDVLFDKYGMSTPTIKATVYDRNYNIVEGLNIVFDLVDNGDSYLAFTQNGATCNLSNAKAHGTAKIRASIQGREDVYAEANINVIVPPERIDLNGVFKENPKLEYAFSMVDPFTGNTEKLPFTTTPISALNSTACQDVIYSFTAANGKSGDEVAVYEDGKITFKTTGKITVDISSNSGSRKEATTSYAFNINQGYNVESFEELSYVVERGTYKGEQINIVVLNKVIGVNPETGAKDYNYGYALVPSIALDTKKSEQPIEKLLGNAYTTYNGQNINLRIQAVNTSLYINGNNTTIDASNVKVFNLDEYDEFVETTHQTDALKNYSSFISAEAWLADGASLDTIQNKDWTVKMFNLKLKGNAPYNYDPKALSRDGGNDNDAFVGAYGEGIAIGTLEVSTPSGKVACTTHYTTTIDNVSVNGFQNGFKFSSLVDSKISNIKVDDCYSTGVVFRSSIATLENLTVVKCGATGIEISEDYDTAAGKYDNQVANIILTGKIDATNNLNAGNSNYFNNYTIDLSALGQGKVPAIGIIQATVADHADKITHVRNADGQFNFVALKFKNVYTFAENDTKIEYSAFDQGGGIININDIPSGAVDTTHQFIEMDITYGGFSFGTAIFYNHNYKPAN